MTPAGIADEDDRKIMAEHYIEFEPIGIRGKCLDGWSLLDCSMRLGVGIASVCGGLGTCNSCKVQIASGDASSPTVRETEQFTLEELKNGWRLACQAYPVTDCKVFVPPESMTVLQRTQVEGIEIEVQLKPDVRSYEIKMSEPTILDNRADAERLLAGLNSSYSLNCTGIDLSVMAHFSKLLRTMHWECLASVKDSEVVAVFPVKSHLVGLAIDLGTTKIAGYLVDIESGKTLASVGGMNPQVKYGEDVISRITYAVKSLDHAKAMQQIVVESINQIIGELCTIAQIEAGNIVDAVIVGNTAMQHFLLGFPAYHLAHSPFVSVINRSVNIKAREIGLFVGSGIYLHVLPNIAGFVGSDHVAALIAAEATNIKGIALLIDIGTNTEISLVDNGNVTSVSCASGPAFEGGHIKCGMRAASGAIERLHIIDGQIYYQTIDNAAPVGICGSGIIDALAQLYLAGIVDRSGKLIMNHPNVKENGQLEFVLVEGNQDTQSAIVITQKDIRELQLAKAAIRTGIQLLLESSGCKEEQINEVLVAGAFGSYIDISSAITIGMFPALPKTRFRQLGNAAGMGAKLALISTDKRLEAERLASKINYLELAGVSDFNQTFIQASYLGPYRIIDECRSDTE